MSFEVNQGQTDARVRFLSRGHGYILFLTSEEAVIEIGPGQLEHRPAADRDDQPSTPTPSVLHLKLADSNLSPRITGAEELPGKSNYFIGNDPRKWHSSVATYRKVRYEGVYPGVDLVYYGNQSQLEYDFVVSPWADPNSIAMKFDGASVEIDPAGDLVLHTDGGEVRFRRPVAYQSVQVNEHGGRSTRRFIDSRFVLQGNNEVAFHVAPYDHSRPLVIDPVLLYSTYLGGSFPDQPLSIAVNSAGSAYVTGITCSADFPVKAGAFQTSHHGSGGACPGSQNSFEDTFVTKFNAAGTGLMYSTYIGGSASDRGYDIAVDSSGNAYISGQTQSFDYPVTTGAFITSCPGGVGGCNTGVVTKLNSTGSALVYSTYIGGPGNMGATGIAVNSAGEAYVTGATDESYPTTAGAFQANNPKFSLTPVFTVLNAAGSALVYSTFLGGSQGSSFNPGSQAFGVAIDSLGRSYITGWTDSSDFPTTTGAFQTKCGTDGLCNGLWDAYVAKFDPTKSGAASLVYSTFLGGSGTDIGFGIAVDSSGNAYVTGTTGANVQTQFGGSALPSPDFPTTAGAFQATCPGTCTHDSAWVTKLNAAGSALVYSTYLGGGNGNNGSGVFGPIKLDSAGNAHVTGFTAATDFPTQSPVQATNGGGNFDAYVTTLNPSGSALVFSTYLGGNNLDEAISIALDKTANMYVTGITSSTNFPHTAGAFQTVCPGSCTHFHGFVSKIGPPATLTPSSAIYSAQALGTTSAAKMFTLNNNQPVALTSIAISTTGDFAVSATTCTASLAARGKCTISVTFTPTAKGKRTGTLSVSDSANNSPQTATLSGTGVLPATLTPATATYASQTVGTTSAAKTFTLTNNLTVTLTSIAISTTGDFAVSATTCTASLAAKSKCTINVTFKPTATGTRIGKLSVSDSASNSPQASSLTGTGK